MSQIMNCKKINGSYGVATAAAELIRDKNGKVTHIEVFLYDTTFNSNGSRLTEKAGDESAPSFIDTDLILTPAMDHNVYPDEPGAMPSGGVFQLTRPVEDYIKASANYSVGKLKQVVKKFIPIGSGNNTSTMPVWKGIFKLTNDRFMDFITGMANKYKDIKEAKLFVSSFYVGFPTVTGLAASEPNTRVVYDGKVRAIHTAIVKSPAFNKTRSLISGICSGPDTKCTQELAMGNTSYSYSNSIMDPVVEEFNNHLMTLSTKLYSNANNSQNMTEDSKDKSPVQATDNDKKESTNNKDDNDKVDNESRIKNLEERLEKVTQILESKGREETKENKDKKEGADDKKDKTESLLEKTLKEQEVTIKELKRERDIERMMKRLAPLKDQKLIEKQAKIFIDKNYSEDEVNDFVKHFAKPLAIANSNEEKEKTDSAIPYNYASASSHMKSIAKEGNLATNIGIASLLNQLT